jgi:hypothetical protein
MMSNASNNTIIIITYGLLNIFIGFLYYCQNFFTVSVVAIGFSYDCGIGHCQWSRRTSDVVGWVGRATMSVVGIGVFVLYRI